VRSGGVRLVAPAVRSGWCAAGRAPAAVRAGWLARQLGPGTVDASRFRPNLLVDAPRTRSPARSCRSGTSSCGSCCPPAMRCSPARARREFSGRPAAAERPGPAASGLSGRPRPSRLLWGLRRGPEPRAPRGRPGRPLADGPGRRSARSLPRVNVPFPEPTGPAAPRAEVLLGYLDYFRSLVVSKGPGALGRPTPGQSAAVGLDGPRVGEAPDARRAALARARVDVSRGAGRW